VPQHCSTAEVHAPGFLPLAVDFLAKSLESAPETCAQRKNWSPVLHALGRGRGRGELARERLTTVSLERFSTERTWKTDVAHLAADPYRVLRLHPSTLGWDFYRRAVEVLARDYAPPGGESEPGTVAPLNHPLVVYFRGTAGRSSEVGCKGYC